MSSVENDVKLIARSWRFAIWLIPRRRPERA
nr:MAG TPA: hypothetical protein [Caudoviricetes sp.]